MLQMPGKNFNPIIVRFKQAYKLGEEVKASQFQSYNSSIQTHTGAEIASDILVFQSYNSSIQTGSIICKGHPYSISIL